jgi:hypothetical protein
MAMRQHRFCHGTDQDAACRTPKRGAVLHRCGGHFGIGRHRFDDLLPYSDGRPDVQPAWARWGDVLDPSCAGERTRKDAGELLDQVLRERDTLPADTGTARLRQAAELSFRIQMQRGRR